jgi:hypothetical protein
MAVISMLVVTGNCSTASKAISGGDFAKVWSGTWIGAESNVTGIKFHKAVFYPDGSYDYCYEINDAIFCDTTKFSFHAKWTDSEGNIWYNAHWENDHHVEGHSMGKFSNSGNTYEEIWKFGDEPIDKWAPDDIRYFYYMWHRQKWVDTPHIRISSYTLQPSTWKARLTIFCTVDCGMNPCITEYMSELFPTR